MRKLSVVLSVIALLIGLSGTAVAQTRAGMKEVGIQATLSAPHEEPGDNWRLSGSFLYGRFVSDRIEVAIYTSARTSAKSAEGGLSLSGYLMGRVDAYLSTVRNPILYVGARAGKGWSYTSEEGFDIGEGTSFGPQGGLKWFLDENTSLNLEYQMHLNNKSENMFKDGSSTVMLGFSRYF